MVAGTLASLAQVLKSEPRQGCQGLRRVLPLLPGPELGQLGVCPGKVLGRPGSLHCRQALGFGGVLVGGDGGEVHHAAMGILKEELLGQTLEEAGAGGLAQGGEMLGEGEGVGCGGIIIEPGGQGRHGIDHAVGHAEIPFPQGEFLAGDGSQEGLGVEALGNQVPEHRFEGFLRPLPGTGMQASELHGHIGLQQLLGEREGDAVGQIRVQQRPAQGRFIGSRQGREHGVHRHQRAAVMPVGKHVGQGQHLVVGGGDGGGFRIFRNYRGLGHELPGRRGV